MNTSWEWPIHCRLVYAMSIGHVLLVGLFQIRDLRHNNIVQFIGATVEPNVSNIVTEYCSKGSLEVLATLCSSPGG